MAITNETILGDRARWGRVGYAGVAHAPAPGTYAGIEVSVTSYLPPTDSGTLEARTPIGNLAPGSGALRGRLRVGLRPAQHLEQLRWPPSRTSSPSLGGGPSGDRSDRERDRGQ